MKRMLSALADLPNSDLKLLFTRSATWRALAAADIRSKYRRTAIGPWWITISSAVFALGMGLVSGSFLGLNLSTYLPYFIVSMTIWNFIASSLNEATQTLISAGGLIKASNLPISFHVMRMVHRNFIIFLHNLVVIPLVWLILPWPIGWSIIWSVLGFLCVYVFITACSLTIAIVCTRYRDIPPLVTASVQFAFFVSPIIWMPDQLRGGHPIILLNPISHLLTICRDPLLSRPVSFTTWTVAVATAIASAAVAAAIYIRYRHRVVFWV